MRAHPALAETGGGHDHGREARRRGRVLAVGYARAHSRVPRIRAHPLRGAAQHARFGRHAGGRWTSHRAGETHSQGDYDLAGVIDFRTQLERDKEPDPRELMEGVVFYDFPALSGETIGITHGAGVAQDLKTFASYNASPHELVRGMYPQILLDDAGRVAYTSFLEVLLEGDGGAYLWHCSEGKDRAGLGAVIVERALGVPEAYVRADYLATNLFARNRAEGSVDAISKKLGLMKGLDTDIDSLFYAYNDYYDCAMAAVNANYGSFDAYLAEALDFGPEKRQALRAKYLR